MNRYAKDFYYYLNTVEDYQCADLYKTTDTPLKMYHVKCGKYYYQTPKKFKRGSRCHHCSPSKPITHENFIDELKSKFGDKYEVLTRYKNSTTPLLVKNTECGHIYKIKRQDILAGKRCFECYGSKKYTQKEFEKKFKEKGLLGYSVVGVYKGIAKHVDIKHDICGTVFPIKPRDYFNQGKHCPVCKPKSLGELKVKSILERLNIAYEEQKTFPECKFKHVLMFDFYLPKQNIIIEYQGIQHYKPVKEFGGDEAYKNQIIRDSIKRNFCKENNIKIIEVPYYIKDLESFLVEKIC